MSTPPRPSAPGPRPYLATALRAGAVVGALILGVGGRIAMRIIALLDGQAQGFSLGGSVTVVFMGAAWGTVGGLLLWLGRRFFARSAAARGALFWGVVLLLAARGLHPLSADRVVVFGPVILLYGGVLYRTWCRRYVARWKSSLAPA